MTDLPLSSEILITVAIADLSGIRCTRQLVADHLGLPLHRIVKPIAILVHEGRLRTKAGQHGGITCTGRPDPAEQVH